MRIFIIIVSIFAVSFFSFSQQSPYSGEELRAIKSLSEKEIEQYQSGAGMGLAKAAELNHYPGPRHILENADSLDITSEQKIVLEQIFETMRSEAVAIGEQIIEKEKFLNAEFEKGTITESRLKQLTESIGMLQAHLRFVHLRAHVSAKKLLSKHQLLRYDLIRGYGGNNAHRH